MSIEVDGLTSCSQVHSLPSPCHPSEPACTISIGISDQTSKQVLHDLEPLLAGSSLAQHAKIEQAPADLQQSTNGECIDEKGKSNSIDDLPIQDYAKTGLNDGNQNGSSAWLGSSSDTVVTPIVSVPLAPKRPSKKLMNFGNRKQGNADKTRKIKKTRSINSILDSEDKLIPSTDGVKGKNVKVGTVEKDGKADTERIPKERTTRSRNFNLSIEYEAKETGKRGRPKKVNGSSSCGNGQSSEEHTTKRGRPKKVKDQISSATNGSEAPTRKRGRPKKIKDQIVDEKENGNEQEEQPQQQQQKKTSKVTLHAVDENENGGEQKPKRGRPKKVKDQQVDENEPVEKLKKRKRKKYYNYTKCSYIFG